MIEKRDLFAELKEGFDALKDQRARKRTRLARAKTARRAKRKSSAVTKRQRLISAR